MIFKPYFFTLNFNTMIVEQLMKYNAFVNVFLNYYKGFYTSDMYNELANEVYNINPPDAVKGICDRYKYCFEISQLDNTTERIQQLMYN